MRPDLRWPQGNDSRVPATRRAGPTWGSGLLFPRPSQPFPTAHPEFVSQRPSLPGVLSPPLGLQAPLPAGHPTPTPQPTLPQFTLRPRGHRSRHPTPPLRTFLPRAALGPRDTRSSARLPRCLYPGPATPRRPAGTHLEELGRRSHPGRLGGSPRAGRRLGFTCCASAAPRTGSRSARQLRLPDAAGSPTPLRAQAGQESGHEAKLQTPVSCLPAPPAPLPLSPPRRRKWSCARRLGSREGRTAGEPWKGSSQGE